MRKEYQKPVAEYISLAAAEQIATNAGYYETAGAPDTVTDVVSNPFN